MNRRDFLKTGSLALLAASSPLTFANAQERRRIVVIQLEGGVDGLSMVVPYGDSSLYDIRRNLIPSNMIEINREFALHPSLQSYARIMEAGNGIVVHATNFPYTRRSHFEGQNVMQSAGRPFEHKTGWLGRGLGLHSDGTTALSLDVPLLVRGANQIKNFNPSQINGLDLETDPSFLTTLAELHTGTMSNVLMEIQDRYNSPLMNRIRRSDPWNLARYAAQELRREDGPDAAIITIPDFDTHANQNTRLNSRFELLDRVIQTFQNGLGEAWSNTLILTLTEFGRTVTENGSKGTEHGYGSAALLAGGLVKKSGVITDWPGLKKAQRHEQRDLKSTIDYRSICAACLEQVTGVEHDRLARDVFFEPRLERLTDYVFS